MCSAYTYSPPPTHTHTHRLKSRFHRNHLKSKASVEQQKKKIEKLESQLRDLREGVEPHGKGLRVMSLRYGKRERSQGIREWEKGSRGREGREKRGGELKERIDILQYMASINFCITVLSRASAHGCSQLKRQKLRVGGYTENELKWFNYLHAKAHARMRS